jgi:hypothetical protein
LALDGRLLALTALASLLFVTLALVLFQRLRDPRDRERRRRLAVNQRGRVAEALITVADENAIQYTCSVGGVTYSASQAIDGLGEYLPRDPARLVGHAWLKYAPQNPANSILPCEQWSGLRRDGS